MRRTYRSKKETGGGLDHKELLQNLGEKSSVFHAFFINNIKQTKRELSCVGPSNSYSTASRKVRKRKYVKRIVPDVDTSPQESMSTTTYLTPDKSIRVNKPVDPFDLLLNTSPALHKEVTFNTINPIASKVDSVNESLNKKLPKCYPRRKPVKTKKFSYSSSSTSDSDKENSCETTQNSSNIKAINLIVEQEGKSLSPKLDDSINKIVKNISLLNKLRQNTFNETVSNSFSFKKTRLTRNSNNSPILQKSPYCSTPFKAKYRGESIYKFSPISLASSPIRQTIHEEIDDINASIIISNKGNSYRSKKSEKYSQSPILDKISCSHFNFNKPNISKELLANEVTATEDNYSNETASEIDLVLKVIAPHKPDDSIEISNLQYTETEPFLGFSVSEQPKPTNNITVENYDITTIKNSISEGGCVEDMHSDKHKDDVIEISFECAKEQTENMIVEMLEEIKPTSQNESAYKRIVENTEQELCYQSNDTVEQTTSQNDDSLNSSGIVESLYDTCSSDEDFQNIAAKEPAVLLTRMNESSFLRYYEKIADYEPDQKSTDSVHSSIEDSFDDFASVNSSISNSKNSSCVDDFNVSSHDDSNSNVTLSNDDSDSNNISSNNDEEKCVSFVTTRRRNELTNNSMISIFSDSYGSSGNECEKTVLSNNIDRNTASQYNADDTLLGNNNIDKTVDPTLSNYSNLNATAVPKRKEDFKEPFIMTRSSVKPRKSSVKARTLLTRSSLKNSRSIERLSEVNILGCESSRKTCIGEKSGIILQPGKKWERSLSIYKRMTIMADHFDQSVLQEESMELKGRKYRQSIITTMEMQDIQGSLHNESLKSRRSTFVSKPSRSTIRIVKDPSSSRLSLSNTTVFDDLKGFLHEECNDTVIELSKLSIADQTHEVTVISNFHDTSSRITTARDYVLRRCNQTDTIPFDECYPDTVLKNCHKIGEGVYGEVFLWRARDGRARVLKIVPIAGDVKVNGEAQKDYHEVISEIVIAMELSALRAPIADIDRHFDEGQTAETLDLHDIEYATDVFNEVLAVRCVYGSYPSRLLDLWDLYDECKGSENDNPAVLPVDQQYMVLELANAGQDLESYQFNNAEQAYALFLQVAYGLAVAEEAFQFEHRDLHWGNILIAPTDQKFASFVLRGRVHRVARRGVAGTVIDYSLSRVSLPLAGGERASLYNDLAADESLFDAVGDYQFQVYRLMREKLGNDWKNFEPYTNVLWLHYTVDKMITSLRYKRTNTKVHKHYIDKLKGIKGRILDYGSAAQFVLTDNEI